MSIVYFIFQQTMLFTIPLMIVALGGMFSERSGVVNIALEGIMIMGAFVSILFLNLTGGKMSGQLQEERGDGAMRLWTEDGDMRSSIFRNIRLPFRKWRRGEIGREDQKKDGM